MKATAILEIGAVPGGENCEQLGPDYRPEVARRECRAYINQLVRINGEPPPGVSYFISDNPHDFGTYHEVAVRFDPTDKVGQDYAYKAECSPPENWDAEARKELGI
jgi:hypothetical protein